MKKLLMKLFKEIICFLNRPLQKVELIYELDGLDAALTFVEIKLKNSLKAKAYKTLARFELSKNVQNAAHLATRSLELNNTQRNRLANCMTLWDAGSINSAYELLQSLGSYHLSAGEAEKARQIEGAYRLYNTLPDIPEKQCVNGYEPNPHLILYVASSSQPYHTTGYTTRTHHLLKSLNEEGWSLHCVTRPGYPYDRSDARNLNAPVINFLEGVPYERLKGSHRREVSTDQYIINAADLLVEVALRLRPALIHAASNYESALPALIAAKRLGLPFCYEVRGLWEYTSASKKPRWEQTERFILDRMLETYTARHADQVFTLTGALANELVQRGINKEKIQLLPNAVNLEFFQNATRDVSLAAQLGIGEKTFVCGYVGSVVKYEGLDDLLAAMPELLKRVADSRLLVVGDGDELDNLRDQAARLGMSDKVIFTGRVSHTDIKSYYSLLNTVVLPRKPYSVCKLVSPLKPFEAMAMKIPLIVSDVDALKEIFEHDQTALIHKADDVETLAMAMIELAENPAKRVRLAKNAWEQVKQNSQWNFVVRPVCSFYTTCGILKNNTKD
jgi:glycosyltransferase involved in cell wall biosynthesis